MLSFKYNEPCERIRLQTLHQPQISNLKSPKNLKTSEFKSQSAITDHATLKKLNTGS